MTVQILHTKEDTNYLTVEGTAVRALHKTQLAPAQRGILQVTTDQHGRLTADEHVQAASWPTLRIHHSMETSLDRVGLQVDLSPSRVCLKPHKQVRSGNAW